MIQFPTTVIDNFLEDPDKIRNIALDMKYFESIDGRWPGKRTQDLHLINKELHNYLCNKVFSIFYDFVQPVTWKLELMFQLIDSLDESKSSAFNKGWIHLDNNCAFGGLLYLSPDADPETGTNIYLPKLDLSKEEWDKESTGRQDKKHEFYKDGIKSEEYEREMNKFNNMFLETVNVKNVYNRLILFDGNSWHGAQNYYTSTNPRLTLNIFVNYVASVSRSPLDRVRRYTF